ncbi:MAG: heme-binding protein [Myxococcota bacterium]
MKRSTPVWAGLAALGMAFGLGMVFARRASASGYESPDYDVETQMNDWEVRRYQPTIQARIIVQGSYEQAKQRGFRQLAGYIFGDNRPNQRIAMTVPVGVSPAEAEGEKIAMTVPVGITGVENGRWRVTFMMPTRWTMETLPAPNNSNIELIEIPGDRMAALRYSGRDDATQATAKTTRLLDAIATAGLQPAGPPTVAIYNGPWVPGPFRQNEILIPVQDAD